MSAAVTRGCVFLLTDYGTDDEFAGLLRAAVARVAPDAPLVDLTHGIAPFDVRAGALTLERCARHLGPGVVVAVVDPGVGTDRRPIAVDVGPAVPSVLVGPDNGLLMPAADALGGVRRAVVLPPPAGATTFDGRDVFAPAAGRLWAGAGIGSVGAPIDPGTLVRLAAPRCVTRPGAVESDVQWIDRFGNVQLAAGPADLAAAGIRTQPGPGAHLDVWSGRWAGPVPVRRVTSFAELAGPADASALPAEACQAVAASEGRHRVGLLVDASGQVALVCDRRSAAAVLGLVVGETVVVADPATARGAATARRAATVREPGPIVHDAITVGDRTGSGPGEGAPGSTEGGAR